MPPPLLTLRPGRGGQLEASGHVPGFTGARWTRAEHASFPLVARMHPALGPGHAAIFCDLLLRSSVIVCDHPLLSAWPPALTPSLENRSVSQLTGTHTMHEGVEELARRWARPYARPRLRSRENARASVPSRPGRVIDPAAIHASFLLPAVLSASRSCGRVVCDDCSGYRISGDRTCVSCWHRIGRKMSGLGTPRGSQAPPDSPASVTSRGPLRSALADLLKVG